MLRFTVSFTKDVKKKTSDEKRSERNRVLAVTAAVTLMETRERERNRTRNENEFHEAKKKKRGSYASEGKRRGRESKGVRASSSSVPTIDNTRRGRRGRKEKARQQLKEKELEVFKFCSVCCPKD